MFESVELAKCQCRANFNRTEDLLLASDDEILDAAFLLHTLRSKMLLEAAICNSCSELDQTIPRDEVCCYRGLEHRRSQYDTWIGK